MMRAVVIAASLFSGAAYAECLDMTVADYDEWERSVRVCAAEAGFALVNPELLPNQFERGLTPAAAYADDEVFRIEYEDWEAGLTGD